MSSTLSVFNGFVLPSARFFPDFGEGGNSSSVDFSSVLSVLSVVKSSSLISSNPRPDRNRQIRFHFVIPHESINPFGDGTKIMVFQLLAFGRSMTEYCPSAHHQVGAGIEKAFVNYKILLFPSEGCGDFAYVLIEVMANVDSSLIEGNQRF